MEIEKFREEIKTAFIEVESESFLKKKIEIEKSKISSTYENLKALYPSKDSFIKSKETEVNLHTTNNEEKMAIGIFLLALEEFAKEIP